MSLLVSHKSVNEQKRHLMPSDTPSWSLDSSLNTGESESVSEFIALSDRVRQKGLTGNSNGVRDDQHPRQSMGGLKVR